MITGVYRFYPQTFFIASQNVSMDESQIMRKKLTTTVFCLIAQSICWMVSFAEDRPPLPHVLNQVILEISVDNPKILLQPPADSPLGKIYARYGQPTIKRLIPHVGDNQDAVNKHVQKIRDQYPKRAQRLLKITQAIPALHRFYLLEFSGKHKEIDIADLVRQFQQDPHVKVALPNYTFTPNAIPSDPYYDSSDSWNQPYDDLWGLKKIQMEDAWDKTTGSDAVTVAVIDTGVDWDHPDIKANMWVNKEEQEGKAGIDDDGNGYIDDVHGYDIIDDDDYPMDESGHGTHVAGIIAAVGNNGIGIPGVMWQGRLMAVRAFSGASVPEAPLPGEEPGQDPFGYYANIASVAQSIVYAADNGADIANLSLGSPFDVSDILHPAIEYAASLGMIMVAGAGNEAADNTYFYPAGFPEMITVAATNTADERAYFSSFGEAVDVAAPGGDDPTEKKTKDAVYNILSLRASEATYKNLYNVGDDDLYIRLAGTSMSAPHVSGLVGLILSYHEDLDPPLSTEEVRQIIRMSADDLGDPGRDDYFGYGRINANQALLQNVYCEAEIAYPRIHEIVLSDTLVIQGSAAGHHAVTYSVEVSKEGFDHAWSPWGTVINQNVIGDNPLLGTLKFDPGAFGKYRLRLRVYTKESALCGEDSAGFIVSTFKPTSVLTNSANSKTRFGEAMATGDINNDGITDLLIGAPQCNDDPKDSCIPVQKGRVFLVYGSPAWQAEISLADNNTQFVSWISHSLDKKNQFGMGKVDQLGYSLAILDYDGDGFDDIALGYSAADTIHGASSGKICLFYGKNYLAWTKDMTDAQAVYCFLGEKAGDYTGFHVINGGDLNGDGKDDLVMSSFGYDTAIISNAGRVYIIYSNADTSTWSHETSLVDASGTILNGGVNGAGNTLFPWGNTYGEGMFILGPGDMTGDGIADLLVAPVMHKAQLFQGGKAGIKFLDNTIKDHPIDGNGILISQESAFHPATALGSGGDLDGDGYSDALVGYFRKKNYQPEFNIIFGKTLMTAYSVSSEVYKNYSLPVLSTDETKAPYMSERNLEDVNYTSFLSNGFEAFQDVGHWMMQGIGDLNGDGLDEFVSGAVGYNVYPSTGIVYGHFGKKKFDSGMNIVQSDFILKPELQNENIGEFGHAIVHGDFNGDQKEDVAMSAPKTSDPRIYIYSLEQILQTPGIDHDGDGFSIFAGDCNDFDPATHPGVPELCDTIDQDCDGSYTNVFPVGQLCDGPDDDSTKGGHFTCTLDGTAVECVNDTQELCNGIDDNGNGQIDEEFFLLGQPCDGVDEDTCSYGFFTCASSGLNEICQDPTSWFMPCIEEVTEFLTEEQTTDDATTEIVAQPLGDNNTAPGVESVEETADQTQVVSTDNPDLQPIKGAENEPGQVVEDQPTWEPVDKLDDKPEEESHEDQPEQDEPYAHQPEEHDEPESVPMDPPSPVDKVDEKPAGAVSGCSLHPVISR